MIEKQEGSSLFDLKKNHAVLTETLARRRPTFSALRLELAIWLKANGRVAIVYLMMVIGLILFWASGGGSKELYSGNLASLVTVAVIFGVIRLEANNR